MQRILLIRIQRPTERCIICTMSAVVQTKASSGAHLRRAAVCLLLAIVSLYNPFLTISGACDVLHVHHPQSFRATVASSELRRCTLDDHKPLIAPPEAFETTDPTPVVPQAATFSPARQDLNVVSPLQQVSVGGFWFRPPPSL
jgi:hypothetical protein